MALDLNYKPPIIFFFPNVLSSVFPNVLSFVFLNVLSVNALSVFLNVISWFVSAAAAVAVEPTRLFAT